MRNPTERQGYHSPIPALDELCGLASLESVQNATGKQNDLNPSEKFWLFSVNLEIARTIPFIYDCIREQSASWQTLNAGIETMIELHKAYNHHIQQQFERLEKEILGGENE